ARNLSSPGATSEAAVFIGGCGAVCRAATKAASGTTPRAIPRRVNLMRRRILASFVILDRVSDGDGNGYGYRSSGRFEANPRGGDPRGDRGGLAGALSGRSGGRLGDGSGPRRPAALRGGPDALGPGRRAARAVEAAGDPRRPLPVAQPVLVQRALARGRVRARRGSGPPPRRDLALGRRAVAPSGRAGVASDARRVRR